MVNCTNFIFSENRKNVGGVVKNRYQWEIRKYPIVRPIGAKKVYTQKWEAEGVKLKNNQLAAASSGFPFSLTEIVVQIEIEKLMILMKSKKGGFWVKFNYFSSIFHSSFLKWIFSWVRGKSH